MNGVNLAIMRSKKLIGQLIYLFTLQERLKNSLNFLKNRFQSGFSVNWHLVEIFYTGAAHAIFLSLKLEFDLDKRH